MHSRHIVRHVSDMNLLLENPTCKYMMELVKRQLFCHQWVAFGKQVEIACTPRNKDWGFSAHDFVTILGIKTVTRNRLLVEAAFHVN